MIQNFNIGDIFLFIFLYFWHMMYLVMETKEQLRAFEGDNIYLLHPL